MPTTLRRAVSSAMSSAVHAPLRLIPPETPMPILSGPLKGGRWLSGVLGSACWLGTYEAENQRRIQRLLRPGGTFYDVGANAGYFTLLAAKGGMRVVAVEPNPVNLRRLATHLMLNDVETRVDIVDAALADTVGTLTFDPGPSPAEGHLTDGPGALTVPVTTLDALLATRGYPPPTVIKIDVEGAELRVLQGATDTLRRHRPTVFLEPHTREMDHACPALLRELGYRIETFAEWPDGSPHGWFVAHPDALH